MLLFLCSELKLFSWRWMLQDSLFHGSLILDVLNKWGTATF